MALERVGDFFNDHPERQTLYRAFLAQKILLALQPTSPDLQKVALRGAVIYLFFTTQTGASRATMKERDLGRMVSKVVGKPVAAIKIRIRVG